LKGKFLSKDLSNLLIDLGIEDLKELKSIVDLDNFDDLKGYTKKAVIEVVKDFEENKDPQKIDIIVDRYMFDEMQEIKKKLDYKFTDNLVLATIDLTNIRTLIRLKKQGQGREFASKVLIAGGAIDKDTLISIINETPENIITKLSTTIYSDIIKEGIENFEEILKVSDGIMLGRGDLKAEIPIEDIPYEEEKIINRMKKSKKKLIVATYILESMRRQDTPTISEANDIY
ncbi:V-type ATPase subunit, partial [Clostridium saudiense]|nr:V-type ATPase subunit [Clostridium saudiense]